MTPTHKDLTRPKFQYIRSPALLKACREIPCQHCGIEDGTVVAAHANSAKMGKGRGIKASDIYIAALCAKCHTKVDSSYCLEQQERVKIWTDAHHKTVQELTNRGLWPANIGRLKCIYFLCQSTVKTNKTDARLWVLPE